MLQVAELYRLQPGRFVLYFPSADRLKETLRVANSVSIHLVKVSVLQWFQRLPSEVIRKGVPSFNVNGMLASIDTATFCSTVLFCPA